MKFADVSYWMIILYFISLMFRIRRLFAEVVMADSVLSGAISDTSTRQYAVMKIEDGSPPWLTGVVLYFYPLMMASFISH